MAAAAAHMLKLKETPPPQDVDGTPFSKAEALAAAASHILTLRSRREETSNEGVKTVEFASGPLGVEFEPEDRFVYLKNLMCEYLATAPEDSARAPMERRRVFLRRVYEV